MSLFDDLPEPSVTSGETAKQELLESDEQSAPNAFVEPISLLSSAIARKGERPEMQDAHTIIGDLRSILRHDLSKELSRLSYFAVFDGHGGSKASAFAAKRLHLHLAWRFPRGGIKQIEKDIKRVLYDSYKKTDEEFLREACVQRPHWRDGSTAASVIIVNNTLYIANLGDSKVVLGRAVDSSGNSEQSNNGESKSEEPEPTPPRLTALCLTRDHNPIDYEERLRIQASGATVQNGRVNNILEVSRSFGDYQFKKQGVTCIPDVRKCQLTQNDRFLLIACDGLWKSFPPDEAVAMTNRLLLKEIESKKLEQPSDSTCELLSQRNLDSVCTQLVTEAVLRMSGDNVTCILIVFPNAFTTPNLKSDLSNDNNNKGNNGKTTPADSSDRDEPPAKLKRTEPNS